MSSDGSADFEEVDLLTGSHYVFGYPKKKKNDEFPALVVITPTTNGWFTRCTHRDICNHDYVSLEPLSEVISWIKMDLTRTFVSSNREEVLELLASQTQKDPNGVVQLGDYFPVAGDGEERVLRHLEQGYA